MRFASLAGFLFAFWLALSGHYTPGLVTAGAVCAILCAFAAMRMRLIDIEGHPVHLLGRSVTYFPWLIREIAKSAWGVAKIILNPRLPISPTMTILDTSQRTTTGRNIYANSITLTPGTITVGLDGTRLIVHALVKDGADDLEAGGMDARVRQFEGAA